MFFHLNVFVYTFFCEQQALDALAEAFTRDSNRGSLIERLSIWKTGFRCQPAGTVPNFFLCVQVWQTLVTLQLYSPD